MRKLLAILLFGRRDLKRCAQALERIADRLEGRPLPTRDLPPAEKDPAWDVAYGSDKDYARAYRKEVQMAGVLGRQPTTDELLVALEEEDGADHLQVTRE